MPVSLFKAFLFLEDVYHMSNAIPYFCTVCLQIQDLIVIDQIKKFKLLRYLFKNYLRHLNLITPEDN